MISGIQLDYGGFDPTFLGITIRFGTLSAWEAFDTFANTAEPVSFSDLPENMRFEALATVSVVSHEARHFHDFMLSPYSARIFRLRIQSLINLLGLLPHLLNKDSNCLFVPLSKWSVLSPEARARYVGGLPPKSDGQQWKAVPIPVLKPADDQEVPSGSRLVSWQESPEKLLQAAILLQNRIADLTYNPKTVVHGKSLQPWQLFELSGLVVQLEDLYHTYGPAETEFFLRRLAGAEKNPYGGMLALAFVLADKFRRPFDARLTSAMAFWSFMGSYEKDGWNACPTERFVRLWDLISRDGFPAYTSDLMLLLNNWSSRLQLSTVEEGLVETETLISAFAGKVAEVFSNYKSTFTSKEFGKLIVQIVQGVQKSNQHMVKIFRDDPWGYVAADQYLAKIPQFINPLLRICFDTSFLHSPLTVDELSHKGYLVQWAREKDQGTDLFSFIRPFVVSPFVFFDSRDVDELQQYFGLVDFLFAERARARIDIQRPGRAFFSDSHISPIEILQ
jgi:hypothetical protein